jgi:chitin deacetylase
MPKTKQKSIKSQLKRDIPLFLIAATCAVLLSYVIITARTWGVLGPLMTRVNTNEKVIALTFDDGPTEPQTSKILSVLHAEQVKATFYLIGVEMVRSPKAADDIIKAGHEIGNHSYTHSSLMFMSWDRLSQEIEQTDTLIRQHGYTGPITIRPPYGHKLIELPVYTAMHQRNLVMWDVVLGNVAGATLASISKESEQIRPGSIAIMHIMYDHNKVTLDSVQPLIKKLKSQGYRFETVSELLKHN